jgi:hypothetical protein
VIVIDETVQEIKKVNAEEMKRKFTKEKKKRESL